MSGEDHDPAREWTDTSNTWPLRVEETHHKELRRSTSAAFFYEHAFRSKKTSEESVALRPLGIRIEDVAKGTTDDYLLYPFFYAHREPTERYGSAFLLISHHQATTPYNKTTHFEAFPVVFSCQTGDKESSYSAIFPLGGNIRNRLWRDEIKWTAWPFYLRTVNNDEINISTPWPFVQRRMGPDTKGGALWPLLGIFERKNVYRHTFALWPLIYHHQDNLNTPNPTTKQGFLPFYAIETSPTVEDVTVIWPFFGGRTEPTYDEYRIFWPLFVQGRGKVFIDRWAPFYTHSIVSGVDKRWYFWPCVKTLSWQEGNLQIDQDQFLFFLLWSQRQRSINGAPHFYAEKTHLWPFYSYWNNGSGTTQFQMLSPLEVFFQNNRAVQGLYSPIFAFYKFQQVKDLRTQSLCWNLVTEKKTAEKKELTIGPLFTYSHKKRSGHFELLKGLLSCTRDQTTKKTHIKLFWMNIK